MYAFFLPSSSSLFFERSFGYNHLKLTTYASEISKFRLDWNSVYQNVNCQNKTETDTMSMLLFLNSSRYSFESYI
jgi:hypothetical protein